MKQVLLVIAVSLLLIGAATSLSTANPGDNHGVSVTCEGEGGIFIIDAFNVSHTQIGQTVSASVKACVQGGGKVLSVGVFHPQN